jgi:hypothetical protein
MYTQENPAEMLEILGELQADTFSLQAKIKISGLKGHTSSLMKLQHDITNRLNTLTSNGRTDTIRKPPPTQF